MKKFILLAVVSMMAISASAVTINWGSGGQVYGVLDGTATLFNSLDADKIANSSIGLFYLGKEGSLTSVSDLKVSDALATSTDRGTKSSTINIFSENEYKGKLIANNDISAGDTFGVFFIYGDRVSSFFTDASMSTAFNSTYTFNGSEEDTTTDIAAFGNATAAGARTPAVYAPVPEPATGMLALAGLAMLIRRKRA